MLNWTKVFSIVLALSCVLPLCLLEPVIPELGVSCQKPHTKEYCFSLYGSDYKSQNYTGLTWEEANDLCKADNKQLAVVDSAQVQQIVNQLVGVINSDLDQVWISGRRRFRQEAWTYINDTRFKGSVNQFYMNKCVKLYIDKHQLFEYREIRCSDNLNVYALCQYTSTKTECQGFYYNGLCYFKSDQFVSWFDGMSYCYQNNKGLGTLAYIGLDDVVLRQWLDTVRGESYSLELLVGIRRQPWVWVSDTGNKSVVYSNWSPGTGDYDGDRCITIAPSDNKRWKDVPCDERWYYFLCQNASRPTTTTTTTTTTTATTTTVPIVNNPPPSAPTHVTNTGQMSSGITRPRYVSTPGQSSRSTKSPDSPKSASTSTRQNHKKLKTEHIIAIVVGIVILAVIIGAVLAIQRCPSKTEEAQISYVKDVKSAYAVHQMTPDVVIKGATTDRQNGIIQGNGISKCDALTVTDRAPTASSVTPAAGTMAKDGDNGSTSTATTANIRDNTTKDNDDGISLSDNNGGSSSKAETTADNNDDGGEDRNELYESIQDTAIWVAL